MAVRGPIIVSQEAVLQAPSKTPRPPEDATVSYTRFHEILFGGFHTWGFTNMLYRWHKVSNTKTCPCHGVMAFLIIGPLWVEPPADFPHKGSLPVDSPHKGSVIVKVRPWHDLIDGLVQERRNSSANALELRLSCTNPSSWFTIVFQRVPIASPAAAPMTRPPAKPSAAAALMAISSIPTASVKVSGWSS